MRRRLLSLICAVMLIVSCCPLPVKADNNDAAFREALKTFLGSTPDDFAVYKWSTVISVMKADGLSVNAIAGACGCWRYESGNDVYAVEGFTRIKTTNGVLYSDFSPGNTYDYGVNVYPPFSAGYDKDGNRAGSGGNGLGLAQWTWGREDTLTSFAEKLPANRYVTVSHNEFREQKPRWEGSSPSNAKPYWVYKTHKIPDLPGQVEFMLFELHGTYQSQYKIIDKLQAATSPLEACKVFFTFYEGGGSNYAKDGFKKRAAAAENAVAAINACAGQSGSQPTVTNPSTGEQVGAWGSDEGYQQLGSNMVSAGYWSESQLSTYCKLTETNLEEVLLSVANRSNLGQKDLEGLTDWERNHDGNLKENGYIATLRWIVQLVGITMTLWAIFIYLAFWFDHINSFVYMDMLHIITIGQLHICPPGEKPTFSLGKKVKTKTVSHFQIVCICMTAMLFGAMLISGVFYNAVNKLVHLILSFIH